MSDKTTECLVCGGPVTRKWRGRPARYCSTECRRAAAAARQRSVADAKSAAKETTGVCAECGAKFQRAALGRPRRFCSDECKRRANNRRQRRAMKPLMQPHEAVCPQCGDTFTARSADRIYCYGKWCGQSAHRAGNARRVEPHAVTCDECGTEFIGNHPSARWCSKQCANRHWGRVRSRRRTDLSPIAYTDLEIFQRDKWRCHLCGKKVSPTADRKAPDGATIDHLLPIALGGRDEPANVACAHNRCNREKRTRAMNEQLAIV